MFFILSKVLDFLLSPMVWIVGLILLSFLITNIRRKKQLLYAGLGLLLFFSNPYLASEAFRAWEGKPVPFSSVQNYETGLVLSGVIFNRTEAPDRVFFWKGADRVVHAVQLYKAGKIKKILITGGTGNVIGKAIPEAGRLREVMLFSGVPDSVITIEDRSRNTRESALYSKEILDYNRYGKKFLLITSAFHIPRSIGCFKKVGLDVEPYAVDFYSGNRSFGIDSLVPEPYSMFLWGKLVHEVAGYVVYKIMGYQ